VAVADEFVPVAPAPERVLLYGRVSLLPVPVELELPLAPVDVPVV
jgi:hypothetical protein